MVSPPSGVQGYGDVIFISDSCFTCKAPKVNCNPVKLASVVSYLQKSRVAHSIKDLEKHLPGVASINGMQVKDYLQALSDENKICVEKIGSGNWYWSFASQDKKLRQKALADAQSTYDKSAAIVNELKEQLAAAQAQNENEAAMLENGSETREELLATQSTLDKEIADLQNQLAAYSDSDPVELERKRLQSQQLKKDAEHYTDDIESMEGWFKKIGLDAETLKMLRVTFYGDEFDEEEGALRELV